MAISTKKGDQGFSDFKKERILKSDPCFEVLGQIDTLMALIIMHCAKFNDHTKDGMMIVDELSLLCAIISGYSNEEEFKIEFLERLDKDLELSSSLNQFIYPFDNEENASFNLIRTQVRTVERWLYKCNNLTNPVIKSYINRLSDWYFCQIIK